MFFTTVTIINNPGPTAIATTIVNANCGASNGSITITGVTGGTAPYTYSFNVAAGAGPYNATTSFTGLAAGSYNLEVKDANGCLFFTTVTIINNAGPTAIATTLTNSNCGAADGCVTITGTTGGTAPYTYSFDHAAGAGPYVATTNYCSLASGSHTIEVKDANGCLFFTTVTIIDNPGPTAIATTIVNSSCGAADGCVTITGVTGGTAPYTYSFDGSAFTATTNYCSLLAGTYPVVIKDANGCLYNVSVNVIDNLGPTAIATTFVNPSCGAADGSITITGVTGGTAPYTYDFGNPVTGIFTSTTSYTGLVAGTYTIIVKDANGCTFTTTVTLIDNAGPTAVATTLVNSSCGAADGCVTIGAVTGGLAPYTFSFNSPSAYGPATNYCGLLAGPYDVYVKDANGCIFMTTVTIIDNPGPTAIATTLTNSSCGNADGCVDITGVTGGSAPYLYSFDGSAFTTTTNYCGQTSGSHTVEVQDANGCKFLTTVTIIDNPGPTAIASTVVDAACGASNGSITITGVTGGTGPYTYSLPSGVPYVGTTSYPNLPAGSYPVDVKDANGCIFSTVISINNAGGPTAVVVTHTDTNCGSSNGTVNIGAVTGGTAPYTYSFNNPAGMGPYNATPTSFTGLAAGVYAIEVKDASGCLFATSVTIIDNPGPTAIATTIVDATCGASNGSVTITGVTGGTAPYAYSFNIPTGGPFGPATSFTNLAPGTYNVEVQDANGCLFLTTVTIIDKPGPTAVTTVIIDTTCGASNGSVTFGAVTGGTAPYTFSFNNSPYTTTTVYSGFAAGIYNIGVTDANGCVFTSTVTINDLPGPTDILTTVVNESCGASDGSITITGVTGGTAPYTYYLNAPPYNAVTSFTGLVAGPYNISVKDANGCIYNETVTITNAGGPTAIATTVVNESCSLSNGSVTLGAVTGGVAPYQYQFGASAYGPATSYPNLPAAGSPYSLNVMDANGCVYSTTITIINSPSITDIAVTSTNETCTAGNGSITLGTVTGGTAPFTYSVCGSPSTSTTVYTGLSAGTCTITVTDAAGCTYSETVTITDSPKPTDIATTVVNETCTGANGSITLGAVTGGTAPYTYTHNGTPSGSTTVYTGLSAGAHIFIVTDVNGCTYTETVTITDAPGPTAIASTTTNATCGVSNGCVTFGAVTGGTPPYQINFENLGYSATTNYCALGAGAHIFDVKDANGCIFSSVININNVGGATDIAVTPGNTSCGLSNGTITLGTVTGGTAPFTYSIDNGPFTSTTVYTNQAAGIHSVTVTGANGCIYSENVTIVDQPGPTAVATTIVDSTCGNANGSVTFGAVTGGTAPYTYTVTAGTASSYGAPTTYSGLAAGPYLLGVKDANGCIFTQSITITTTTAPTASITYANAPFCNTLTTAQPVTLTGTGVFTGGTYSATPPGLNITAANGDINLPSTPGTYTVTYTIPPTGGCPAITATTSVTIDPTVSPTITCGVPTTTSVQFNWNAVAGATGYTISYTVNGTPTFPATPIGNVTTYTVTTNPSESVAITVMPTGGFGTCFVSSTFTCVANSCIPSTATINYNSPFCDNNGTPQNVTLTGTGNYLGGTYSVMPTVGLFVNPTTGDITPSASGSYTITYTLAASGGCPAVTDDVIVVVTPLPTATINYGGSPYCSSLGTPQAVTINGTGAYTGGTFTASPAGLTINPTTGAITPSAPTIPRTYTVTYTIPASAGCAAVPVTTTVTVTQQPSATISYTPSTFCVSDTSPRIVTIAGLGAYTGGTYSSPGLIIDPSTGTITGGTVGTHTVTYTIPASAGCATEIATTTVTVDPLPVATATPSTSTICSGATTNIALNSNIPGTTFTWTVVESVPTGAGSGSGNSINQTLSTSGSSAATVTYTITPTTANGCVGNTITATVTVNPSPNVVATPNVQTICSGQTTGIVLTSSTAGTTYTWVANPTNVSGAAASGSGNFISEILTATSPTTIGTVVYTITPTGSTCSGTPINVTVYVTPPPVATATPNTRTICSGESTNIVLTSTIPGTVFNWNAIGSSVDGTANGTGNIIDQVLTSVGTNPGRATYAITPVTSGCPGATIFVDIIVNPIPVVTANPASDSICSGSTTNISLSSNLAATTYSWTVITSGLVFGASSGSGDLIAQTLTVLGSSSGSVTYTITPVSNNCTGASIDVTVVVNPSPEVFADTSSVTICSGESPNITLFPSVPGTTFTWTYVATGVTGASNGNTDFIDQDLFATGTTPGTVVYTVIPTANGCTGLSSDFTVTVNPLPTPTLEDGIICVDANGDTFKTYTFETGFSNATYDFVWSYFNGTTTTIINGASSNSYEASEVGTYYVQVTNTITGCVSPLVSGVVTSSTPAANVSVTGSVAFTDNATITVLPAGYLYSLDQGIVQEENVFTNITPGTHSVTITDVNGCTNETKTVFIIGYPHYFTPNGDGINDNWNIIGLDASYNAKIYIFDRYGKLIKQISPNGQGWDGTYNGEPLPSTDYWFNVEYIELGVGKLFNSHFSLKR